MAVVNLLRTSLATAVVALSIAAASGASASPITQVVTVGGGIPSVTTDLMQAAFNSPINFFNAAAIAAANPGSTVTLNDVKLQYQVQATTGGTLTNTANQAQTFQYSERLAAYLDGGSANSPNAVFRNFGLGSAASISIVFPTVTYTSLASGAAAAYPAAPVGTLTGNGGPLTFTDAATLASFTGNSSFTVGLSTLTEPAFVGGGGNIATTLVTKAGGTFAVTYDYTLNQIQVPEPTTIALVGASLLGICVVRRRKNG